MQLTKETCKVSKSESGNFYISHPEHKVLLRFYADEEELTSDKEWRKRVSIRTTDSSSYYAVLAKSALEELDF